MRKSVIKSIRLTSKIINVTAETDPNGVERRGGRAALGEFHEHARVDKE